MARHGRGFVRSQMHGPKRVEVVAPAPTSKALFFAPIVTLAFGLISLFIPL